MNEILTESYTAYALSQDTRQSLLTKFPPKYQKFIGSHITYQFGIKPTDTELPPQAQIKVIGYIDSGDGLEALVVSVNGSTTRPDGKTFHITWSLDPDMYKPVHTNDLLQKKRFTVIRAIPISGTPEFL